MSAIEIQTLEIPVEFKCSRCKKDMRLNAKKPCTCNRSHPALPGSKSGLSFLKTDAEYRGLIK